MNDNFKYSILIPVYNVRDYLDRCIISIISQDYDTDEYEIIITDDGSTDGSSELCDRYATEYNRIQVIHQPNSGLLAARVRGIREATGEYLIFVDSDDYVAEELFSTLDRYIDQYAPDFIMYSHIDVYDWGCKSQKKSVDEYRLCSVEDYIREFSRSNKLNAINCKTVRTDIIRNHIDEISNIRSNNSEDRILTALLLKYSQTILLTNRELYYYVHRGDSIAHKSSYLDMEDFMNSQKVALRLYQDAVKQSTIPLDEQRVLLSRFKGLAINGLLEKVYKLDTREDMIKSEIVEELRHISEMFLWDLLDRNSFKYIKIYNRIRMKILSDKKYGLLFSLDWILRQIQKKTNSLRG